jgi:hypothetical protein
VQLRDHVLARVPVPEADKKETTATPIVPDGETTATIWEYLNTRGFVEGDANGTELEFEIADGYLFFGKQAQQGRYLGDFKKDDKPKYLSRPDTKKELFWITRPQSEAQAVWLTEGMFDGLTLAQIIPGASIASVFGANSFSEKMGYDLRGRTVFVLFDADHAGYKGAKDTAETLVEFDANPIILELPDRLGNDLNQAWVEDRDELVAWVNKRRAEFATSDEGYVQRLFGEKDSEHILTVPTGSAQWDHLMAGGFRPGVHVVGAESGAGKTSWAVSEAKTAASSGHRVLYVTNEVSKRQLWARLASTYDGTCWAEIEQDPTLMEPHLAQIMALGENIRVVAGWGVPKIKYQAWKYDVIIVDYLQRMDGPYNGDSTKQNVDYNISELSNLGRDLGKVVIVISSMNRNAYGNDVSKKDFKESGSIEYVSQSVAGFRKSSTSDRIQVVVVKNTRGKEGRFWLSADLAHQRFTDADPIAAGQETKSKKPEPWAKAKEKMS